jgi:hypothetical protein
VSSTTAEWLLEISGLTVGNRDGAPADIVDHGRALAEQVRLAAASFTSGAGCTPRGCSDECSLAAVDGGPAACRLARVLAPAAAPDWPQTDPTRATLLYLQALQAASTAVFHCRRHAHPAGDCWFTGSFVPGAPDTCGDVLAVAHRLGY